MAFLSVFKGHFFEFINKKIFKCYFWPRMFNFPIKSYDVVVCGAGPAGLKATYDILKQSGGRYSVLLLDRKFPWKEPVICAEAVSVRAFSKYWPVKQRFVRGNLSGVYFVAPNGSKAEFYRKDCGLQLNRAEFHKDLFEACESLGVQYDFATRAGGLKRLENGLWNIDVEGHGKKTSITARVVVDATGPGDKLTKHLPEFAEIEDGKADLEPAAFAIVEGVEHSREHIELYFGSEFFGGYGWVFPRDGIEVNLGLVLGKEALPEHSARSALEKFLERFPTARIKGFYGGPIACGQSKKQVAKFGLFKAGDAASTVNPISRSGIVEALKSGTCTAESVIEWLAASDPVGREKAEKAAFDRWFKLQGKTHLHIAKAKKSFNSISDEKLNKAADKLSRLTREKSSIFRIFFTVLATSPSIIWKMRSFLKG